MLLVPVKGFTILSSDTTTHKSQTLPTEIIYHITHFLGPLELIHLRRVSKQFYAIANDPTIWRTLYQNARLPRPPGPFPWQSIWFLQHTLIRSARLEKTWTSQPMKVTSCHQLSQELPLKSTDDFIWVSGGWLFIKMTGKIVLQDIRAETGFPQQTLWDHGLVSCWTMCSIMCAQGHLIYLVLCIGSVNHHDPDSVKLLEFRVDGSSRRLSGPLIFDVPTLHRLIKPRLHCMSAEGPFVLVCADPYGNLFNTLVFDIRSRIFYKFPQSRTELEELQLYNEFWFPETEEVSFTMTHIFVVFGFHLIHSNEDVQLIQAFIIPDSQTPDVHGTCELSLSHEAIHRSTSSRFILIRDSIVNNDDGATTLRFLHIQTTFRRIQFFCIDFFLPASQDDAILPISLDTLELFTIEGSPGRQYLCASEDGFARGFYTTGLTGGSLSQQVLHKFTIDASGERCVGVLSEHSPPMTGLEFFDGRSRLLWIDGIRGMACYSKDCEDVTDDTGTSGCVTLIVDF